MAQLLQYILIVVIPILILIFAFYKYMTKNFDYWEKRNVAGPKPVPLFGNFFKILTFKTNLCEGLKSLYDCSNKPYIGIFVFDKPVLLLRSPELIKDVLVTDSHVFLNKTTTLPNHNRITTNYLFFQKMSEWKENRNKYTPCFSPAKIKSMFTNIKDIAEEMDEYIHNGSEVMDVRDLGAKFMVETIARCLFGLKASCFQNEKAGFMNAYREALRKYTAIPYIGRRAASQYKFRGTDLVIEEGTRIFIPMYGLHMDEKYFPKPKVYNPERLRNFSCSQDGKLVFVPFGAGPKRCFADRFGITAMKVALMQILSKYRLDRTEDTPDELVFETKTILMKPKAGTFLKISSLS